ncbi:MAG: YlmC/YmxH family sporulation protein, partial [Clostridia bacterium]|nr:YlmC/YmxH family sporulation protein [Clostridia bacterium]
MKKRRFEFSTFRELAGKDVINQSDGKKLGRITDLGLDPCRGQILSLILPDPAGSFFTLKREEIVIRFDRIIRFGEDVIIVDIGNNETG